MSYALAKTHSDKLSHLTDDDHMPLTLCSKRVRRTVNKSQADRCPDCDLIASHGKTVNPEDTDQDS